MKRWKRMLTALLLAVFTLTSLPLSAGAVSTASEIRIGQDAAKHVDAGNFIIADPILNNWVNSMGDGLAKYRARPDIHYTFKIIDTNDINAFSLPGGFVYVNFGLLNFVNSDDEAAGVLGHEMGHVERRHQITLEAKAQALNILLGVLSLAVPFVYRFGNLIGGLTIYKFARIDELQADQYGLLLMSRAGYDPTGMVAFMQRLQKEFGSKGSGIEKYFETHPDPGPRISHLLGYPQLDKSNTEQILAQAIHDEEEGRFAYALTKLSAVLDKQPSNQLALLHKGQVELALGSFDKSHAALASVASSATTSEAHSAAQRMLAMLPRSADADRFVRPNLDPLRKQVADALAKARANQTALEDRVKLGKTDFQKFSDRVDSIAYEAPNFSNIDVRPGSRLDAVIYDIEHMAKDIDALLDRADFTIKNSAALQKDDVGVLNEVEAPLRDRSPSPTALSLFPYYRETVTDMNRSADDLVNGMAAARGAIALGWEAMPALEDYFRVLDRMQLSFGGDISPADGQRLKPLAAEAFKVLDRAANASEEAQKYYFSAQSRQLQSRITLLGVGFPEARYAMLRRVMERRLGITAPTFAELERAGISPGDAATASWIAAEQKVPVSTVLNEQRVSGKSLVDMALDKHLSQQSLEVVLGLWWVGYTEKSL